MIGKIYHNWMLGEDYSDIAGFCASATTGQIANKDFSLTPGLYVGNEKLMFDDTQFEETMMSLCSELSNQIKESVKLDANVKASLNSIGFDI